MYRKELLSGIVLACCVSLTGCSNSASTTPANTAAHSQTVSTTKPTTKSIEPSKSSATTRALTGSVSSITWNPEPGSAARPWVNAIDSAKSTVYLNEYLVTDKPIAEALISAGNRGVDVKVIADAHPYNDSSAVAAERAEFARTKIQIKFWSPSAHSFDHAKYMVVDGKTAIVGSANADYSAMQGGRNLEADVTVNGGSVPTELLQLFNTDWSGRPVSSPKYPLIVSPGSESGIVGLLKQPGTISVVSEELGSDPRILQAMEQKGKELQLLLPASISSWDMNNVHTLMAHGVQVRLLKSPYVHAKVILSDAKVFVGSENLTTTSLDNNREVGLVLNDSSVFHQATTWFSTYWSRATPLNGMDSGAGNSYSAGKNSGTKTTSKTRLYPYLSLGLTENQVKTEWGTPSRVSQTTYRGAPETVWQYPNGDKCYFDSKGRLVYVKR